MRPVIMLTVAGIMLAALPTVAQTSVGFENPNDLDALLSYRLPDWGYRTWDGSLFFAGNGQDGDYVTSSNHIRLGTSAEFFRESERRVWRIAAAAQGLFSHAHQGDGSGDSSTGTLGGRATISPNLQHYLGQSNYFARVVATGTVDYSEHRLDDEFTDISRMYHYGLGAGIGIGRVRDVTPLIRAQRLSERLVALDRAPLTAAQVVEIAQVFAQEGGYRIVFDRGERRFWRDVLEPLLDPDRPLTVYEVKYLEEVLLESVGNRQQGQDLAIFVSWQEDQLRRVEDVLNTRREVGIEGRWIRNLSLIQQLEFAGRGTYGESQSWGGQRQAGTAIIRAAYLHNVSDRNLLTISASANGTYYENEIDGVDRVLRNRLEIMDRFYIEDRVVLRPHASVSHRTGTGQGVVWRWEYGLTLDYYFDRLLY